MYSPYNITIPVLNRALLSMMVTEVPTQHGLAKRDDALATGCLQGTSRINSHPEALK